MIWTLKKLQEFLEEHDLEAMKIDHKGLKVYGEIDLSNRDIEDLQEFIPPMHTLEGNLVISGNKLTSLKGCPIKIKGDLDVYNNKLKSLKGPTKWVEGYFACQENKDLRFTQKQLDSLHVKGEIAYDQDQLIIVDPLEFNKNIPL